MSQLFFWAKAGGVEMADSPKTEFLFEQHLKEALHELEDRGMHRKLRTLKLTAAHQTMLEGRPVTLFCSNDYLGLSRHPRLIKAFQDAAVYGTGSGAARLISGSTDFHDRLEKKIAQFKGCEKALLFSTGYLANLGVLSALAGEGDLILMDKLCHASLIDGARLSGAALRIFPHKQYGRCEEILSQSSGFRRRLLVTDSVFSMDGDIADLGELIRLKETYDAVLVVDDAHGTGVTGPKGRGSCEDPQTGKRPDVVVGTLSKALGCLGGFAAGSEAVIETLVNRARSFIFATSLPPAVCAAAYEAFCVVEEEPSLREKLHANIKILEEGLKNSGFDAILSGTPIFPVILGEERAALEGSKALLESGFLIPAIRYPTVAKGKARLRITVSAIHSEKEIRNLIDKIRLIKKQTLPI